MPKIIRRIVLFSLLFFVSAWMLVPFLIEQFIRYKLEDLDIESEFLSITDLDADKVEFGKIRQCYTTSSSRLCFEASKIDTHYIWSIYDRTVGLKEIEIFDPVLVVTPIPTVSQKFSFHDLRFPPLSFDFVPSLKITLHQSKTVPEKSSSEEIFLFDGSAEKKDDSLNVQLFIEQSGRKKWNLTGRADGETPLRAALTLDQKPILELSVADTEWAAGHVKVLFTPLLVFLYGENPPLSSVIQNLGIDTEWKKDGREIDIYGQAKFVDVSSGIHHHFHVKGEIPHHESFGAHVAFQHEKTGIKIEGMLKSNETLDSGTLAYSVRPTFLPVALKSFPFVSLYPIAITSGSLIGSGVIEWKNGVLSPTLEVKADDVHGRYGDIAFSEINGELHPLPSDGKKGAVQIGEVHYGEEIKLDTIASTIIFQNQDNQMKIQVSDVTANLLGGSLSIPQIVWERDQIQIPLSFHSIRLADLLALHKQAYIEAQGTLNAEIPISWSAKGMEIKDGSIHSEGAGVIRYLGNAQNADSLPTPLSFVQQALEEYRFTSLAAALQYSPDGIMRVQAQLEGKSPKLNTERPVNVNLQFEENMKALLRSLQISNEIEQKLKELQ